VTYWGTALAYDYLGVSSEGAAGRGPWGQGMEPSHPVPRALEVSWLNLGMGNRRQKL
jgi:hypothetical protein